MGGQFEYLARGLVTVGLIIAAIDRLPGDISIKRENFSLYFPITTGIIVSIIISLILYLFRR